MHNRFNDRDTDDYLNDKREASLWVFVPFIVFGLMIALILYLV